MWGLLFFIIIGIGCFVSSCKIDSENARRREQSKQDGKDTYFDYNGKPRLVNNNHQIDRTIRLVNGELDHVLIDTKTEKILHNYSEDKRQLERQKEINARSKDIEERREAKKEGRYFYAATGESRIKDGFYEDSPVNYLIRHYRRVSDDLLLSENSREGNPIQEARCEFYIWAGNAEKCNDLKTLRELAARNWEKVLNWDSKFNRGFRHDNYFPTQAEAEAYARRLNAYFPDTIRDGRPLLLTEVDEEALKIIRENIPNNIYECNMFYCVKSIQAKLVYAGYLIRNVELQNIITGNY